MLPHACIDHISQMYYLGLTGSAQRESKEAEVYAKGLDS